ncbi:hypothetical protein O181_002617 [Austropuccinia psidii MF-1]|uniref:Retrotransposon gag domain-containing protein n=1 Tax=Austropuccinia psidii MF-1 TaxID=1389203 RepID=A0A9Q3BD45_9BASI|nr:hypothetical protein [Austropuccinia psidii MF-1]
MPVQHSPPERQIRAQAVLTPTPRDSLDETPAVPQLRAHWEEDQSIWHFPGISKTTLKVPGKDDAEEDKKCVEEEESDSTEATPTPVRESQGTGRPNLAHSNQSEPSLLAIMKQMTHIMANIQSASSSEASIPPASKTPSMKEPDCFCQDETMTKMGEKWIEPYLPNLNNQYPAYLLNNWDLFQSQLFTLSGNLNEVRKAEAELDGLRMKEGGHVSLYISDLRSLVSRIGYWFERACIHHFRKGFPSRILDQFASNP